MKILKVPSYYTPELTSSTHLSTDLEDAYLKEGFTIEIFCPTPTRGVSKEVRKKYKKIKHEELKGGKITVNRFSMFREGKNPIQRALRYILVNMIQRIKCSRAKNIDIVTAGSTPPTQGILCGKIAKKLSRRSKKKVPFIYNLQDVFPDSMVNVGMTKRGSLLWKIGRRIEDKTYAAADIIVVISESMKKNIMDKGVPEEKIRVIPNWIDADAVRPVAKDDNKLFDELGLAKDKFRIVYAGNLGMAQGVDVLLDAAEILSSREDIEFVIFGKGAQEDQLKKRAEGMANVKFFPLMPIERVPEVYSLGDACVVLCKKGTGGAGVPSKTWSIMACATPLLISFDLDSDYCRTVDEIGAGLCSDAEDAVALAANVLKVIESDDLREKMGKAARSYAENVVSKDVCVAKYIELMKSFEN